MHIFMRKGSRAAPQKRKKKKESQKQDDIHLNIPMLFVD